MASFSKSKGSSYERAVCHRMSLWVSNMSRTDVFWRSAMSGGRATVRMRRKHRFTVTSHAGDLTATHPLGHLLLKLFTIECKSYKDLALENLLFGKQAHVLELWHKPRDLAVEIGREPLVIAKQNRKGELVFTTKKGWEILRAGCTEKSDFQLLAYFAVEKMYIFSFRDLLTDVDFSKLRKIYDRETRKRF